MAGQSLRPCARFVSEIRGGKATGNGSISIRELTNRARNRTRARHENAVTCRCVYQEHRLPGIANGPTPSTASVPRKPHVPL